MTPNLRIHLFGEFRLLVDNHPLTTFNKPRQQALLAYLLLHRHAPQSRQQIAFSFWPNSTESQAYTNLRKLFFDLRQALPNGDTFLTSDTLSLGWRSDAPFTLDVAEVEKAFEQLEKGKTLAPEVVERVVALYKGELLPTCYEEWLLPVRRALHERVVNTLTDALAGLEAQHEYQVGLRTADHLLRLDPLHEATYRHLMNLRALNGDRAGALRIYHECVTMLEQELGVSPATETQGLYQQLLKAEPQVTPTTETPLIQRHEHIPLVGRKQEWQILQQAWQQMTSHGPQMLVIWGEAGVGKTRLVEELLHWAKLRPGTVAYARSYEAEGALSYAPLTEWLRSASLRKEVATLEELWRTELARLLPELLVDQPSLPPPVPITEGWQYQRFHEALARAILAAPSPHLLVLDDLQWSDTQMQTWLHYLLRYYAQNYAQTPLLIVGTVRTEAVDEQHPLSNFRRQLQRDKQWTEIELDPLSVDETVVLAGHLTNADLSNWQAQLYQETEGNPLFVMEMVQAGLITGQGAVDRIPMKSLPSTIHSVISMRLGQLSSQAHQLAQVAATVGRDFGMDVLAAASELDEDSLVQGIDELWQRRIIREQHDGYDFSHDKIREVAYAGIPPMRRRLLHRRIAQALELVHAKKMDAVSGQIAAHWEAAGYSARACNFWQRAGIYSAARYDNKEAVHYFGRGLSLVEADDQVQRYDLLLARVRVLNRQGQRDEERADLVALQELVDLLPPDQDSTRKRAEVALCAARYCHTMQEEEQAKVEAMRAAHLAEEVQNIELAAEAYYLWGATECFYQANYHQAEPHLERALHLARQVGLQQIEANTLQYLVVLRLYTGGQLSLVELQARQTLAIHRQCGDKAGEAFMLALLAYIILTQGEGRYLEAIGYCQKALAFGAETIGWDAARFAVGSQGYLYYLLGDYTKAQANMDYELSLCHQAESPGPTAGALWGLGSLSLDVGDYKKAEEQLTEALRINRELGGRQYEVKVLGLLALVQTALGQSALARNYGEQAVALALVVGDPRLEATAFVRLGQVLLDQGEAERAEDLFQQALVHYQQMEQQGQALKAMAGLAEVSLQRNELQQALDYVTQIINMLPVVHLDATDEVLDVYLTCYQVLRANEDLHTHEMLDLAHAQLQTRAGTLQSEGHRKQFWSVFAHGDVRTAMQRHLGECA